LVDRVLNFWPLRLVYALVLLYVLSVSMARGQDAPADTPKHAAKTAGAHEKPPELPAQIELLETHVRFEANGDTRKEVHTRVHINNELGARQFARLIFDYNRSFQQIEFPLVRITHEGGGTVDILPSAISDNPNPAVVNAPAYQDVRVKSLRILGLAPGDLLEYRVVTITSHHPLAPDFWLDHTFDRSGVVAHEIFDLDLPGSEYYEVKHRESADQAVQAKFPPGCALEWMFAWKNSGVKVSVCGSVPYTGSSESSTGDTASRSLLRWDVKLMSADVPGGTPDVIVSTLDTGYSLVERLAAAFSIKPEDQRELQLHLQAIPPRPGPSKLTVQDAYEFVSQKLATVDLPVGATGFRLRGAKDVLDSGYATPEEKCMLLAAFARALEQASRSAHAKRKPTIGVQIVFPTSRWVSDEPIRPSMLEQPLVVISDHKKPFALDPSLEVAPFAFIPSRLRGKRALSLTLADYGDYQGPGMIELPLALPFRAFQRVNTTASIDADGALSAKVSYALRGDNEFLLRETFHQSPKEKWAEVAQLLALSDGFRGKVTRVSASDPYATHDPFTVEYEITQPKFVDWSKKPVRIPALLPQLGLPDPPSKPATGAATSPIDLGTPLDVETHLTLHLPPGTLARTPTGTSVGRDYATFASQYAANGATVTATRRLNFLLRKVRGDRAADYNAFVRAVQGDEAQEFTLERGEVASQPSKTENSPKKN
jgi:Domain of Unknown Function with PDB structure (DUF3857)